MLWSLHGERLDAGCGEMHFKPKKLYLNYVQKSSGQSMISERANRLREGSLAPDNITNKTSSSCVQVQNSISSQITMMSNNLGLFSQFVGLLILITIMEIVGIVMAFIYRNEVGS